MPPPHASSPPVGPPPAALPPDAPVVRPVPPRSDVPAGPPATPPPEPPPGRPTTPGGTDGRGGAPRPPGTSARRTTAAAACLVLGLGLLGGAAAGTWLTGGSEQPPVAERVYREARSLWRDVPVDDLFPPTLQGRKAGPGGADREWIRVAVAPDGDCSHAFDQALAEALAPAGCHRLVRATYVDATTSNVTTVGLLFTKAGPTGMRELRQRVEQDGLLSRPDAMPRPYAARGTAAADFGDTQRASWTLRVHTDAPVVVYAVSGFADGRTVSEPQPAAEAVKKGATTAPAQAGLGHAARGIADRIEHRLSRHVTEVKEAAA